jgi:acyl-CoA thioester hydrolase
MFIHSIKVRFRDLDALRHVNNSVYLTFLEEARIAYMQERQAGSVFDAQHGTIVARCEIDYRSPATLGDTLDIEMTVGEIRRSSFEFVYTIYRQSDRQLIAQAKTIMVCYNYTLSTPVRLPEEWQQLLEVDRAIA